MFQTQKSRRPGREEEEYKALLRKNPLKRIRETKKEPCHRNSFAGVNTLPVQSGRYIPLMGEATKHS